MTFMPRLFSATLWLLLSLLVFFSVLFSPPAQAEVSISLCFNYGCLTKAEAVYSDEQLSLLKKSFALATNAAEEREKISVAMGLLLGWAGEQTAISADRGGNYADGGVYGKMDCIDHSTTTTRLLHLLVTEGIMRFHRVLAPVKRRFLIFDHFSALIEELPIASAPGPENAESLIDLILPPISPAPAPVPTAVPTELPKPARFAVDTWFYDNGLPAAIIPLERWQAGESPNDV